MKLPGLIFLLCLCGLFSGLGCSREEPPPPAPKPKVVKKSIAKAPVEPAKPVAPAAEEKAKPAETAKPEPPAKAEEKPKPEPAAKAPEKPQPPAAPKVEEKPKHEIPAKGPEKPKPVTEAKVPKKLQPEPRAKAEEKPAPQAAAKPEKKEPKVQPPPKVAQVQPQEKAPGAESSKGSYAVKKGDTLATVSAKTEVYGDPLKWAILYRTNLDVLGSLPQADNLPDLGLPSGIRFRILSEDEMKKNAQKRAGCPWVVNALSALTQAEVVPAVIILVKHDYPVYVTTAKVNNKDWLRLRVGFFKTREEADEEGKKIMELLRFKDSWTTKLGTNEFSDFARY
ncbi:MAG: SPOR domain-containing protein [Thermodesulfobacteriota bacterium]